MCCLTLIFWNCIGKEGKIHISHAQHAQPWCDKKMPCGRSVESNFCKQAGTFSFIYLFIFFPFPFFLPPLPYSQNGNEHELFSVMCYLNSHKFDLIIADPGCIRAGCIWRQLTSWIHFPGFGYKRITTHIFSHKQVHFCISGNCWCLRVRFTPNSDLFLLLCYWLLIENNNNFIRKHVMWIHLHFIFSLVCICEAYKLLMLMPNM